MNPGPGNTWIVIYPQFLDPIPRVVSEAPFRQALLRGIDRQQVAETVQAGLFPVAHTFTGPSAPEFAAVQGSAVRYEYDLRLALQALADLGYAKVSDGSLVDGAGQKLSLELRTTKEDIHEKSLYSVGSFWEQLGLRVDQVVVPQQRVRDQEYRATFPSFQVLIQPSGLSGLDDFRSANVPTADTSWVGSNKPRYRNVELDGLVDRYFITVPPGERQSVLGQIEQHLSERLVLMPLFYSSNPFMMSNRIRGMSESRLAATLYNVHQWDLG